MMWNWIDILSKIRSWPPSWPSPLLWMEGVGDGWLMVEREAIFPLETRRTLCSSVKVSAFGNEVWVLRCGKYKKRDMAIIYKSKSYSRKKRHRNWIKIYQMMKPCLLVCSAENLKRYDGYSNSSHNHCHHHISSSKNKITQKANVWLSYIRQWFGCFNSLV